MAVRIEQGKPNVEMLKLTYTIDACDFLLEKGLIENEDDIQVIEKIKTIAKMKFSLGREYIDENYSVKELGVWNTAVKKFIHGYYIKRKISKDFDKRFKKLCRCKHKHCSKSSRLYMSINLLDNNCPRCAHVKRVNSLLDTMKSEFNEAISKMKLDKILMHAYVQVKRRSDWTERDVTQQQIVQSVKNQIIIDFGNQNKNLISKYI